MAQRTFLSGLMGRFGYVRAEASTSQEDKGFRGARTGRRSAGFEAERRHINTAIQAGGALLRGRSRFMVGENPLGISAQEVWTGYAVGTGIIPSMQGVRPAVKKAWMKAFYKWIKTCDFDGQRDYFGIQAAASDECFAAGEVFIRKIISADQPLKLQLLASEQLPYNLVSSPQAVPGNTIRLGIEFNPKGQRVAYHFLRSHPGDSTARTTDRLRTERVPADEVRHIYRAKIPGQIRGVPQTRGALIPANLLEDYEDSLLERARAGTRPIGFVEKPDDATDTGSGAASSLGQAATNNGDGTGTLEMEPGTLLDLNPGEKVSSIAPPDPGANYGEFRYAQSTRATSAMGVPNAEVTGDLRNVNFSSMRGGRMPFKRRIEQFQHLQLVVQMLDPIWAWFAADAMLFGLVSLPRGASRSLEAYCDIAHMGPKWEYVNPREDAQTDVLLVNNLLKPRSDAVAETGWDPEEADERIAEDQRREARLGLKRRDTSGKDADAAQEAPTKPQPAHEGTGE